MEGRPDFGGRWPSGEAGGKKKKRKKILQNRQLRYKNLHTLIDFVCGHSPV